MWLLGSSAQDFQGSWVKDCPVSFLFLVSWLVAKNISLVKWLWWKHSSVWQHDGEPSWFLLAWSWAVKVAQALTNYVLPGRCKTNCQEEDNNCCACEALCWCGQRLAWVTVLLGNLERDCVPHGAGEGAGEHSNVFWPNNFLSMSVFKA